MNPELATLRGHSDDVNSAAFSPDGTRIVTAWDDNTARVWDAASFREVAGSTGLDGLPIEEQFTIWKLQRYRNWQVRKINDEPDSALASKTRAESAAEVTAKFKAAHPAWAEWFLNVRTHGTVKTRHRPASKPLNWLRPARLYLAFGRPAVAPPLKRPRTV